MASHAVPFDRRRRSLPPDLDQMSLGDILHRLSILSPSDVVDIKVVALDRLKRCWPKTPAHPLKHTV